MGRFGVDSLVEEDMADGISIGIGMYQTCDGVRCGIGAMPLVAQTPA